MRGRNPKDMLEEIKRSLAGEFWNHSYMPTDWFFPSDVSPHDSSFKYLCKRLHEIGLLNRSGNPGRWGYRYQVKEEE